MNAPDPGAMARICAIARREAGLALGSGKAEMVHARLRRRLRSLGEDRYDRYCDLLEADGPAGARERVRLVEALTTQVGAPFREPHHFDLLAAVAAERLAAQPGRRLRLWSAGCADGAEPFSMAATLQRADLCGPERIEVLGTDISDAALARGRDGRAERPTWLSRRWADRVCLEVHNLLAPPPPGPFDVVFCRNVTIYFDAATAAAVHRRLLEVLASGGLLCLGHSERLLPEANASLRRVGHTAWRARRKEGSPCP